tara:strand:+ start:797 stop:1423 length:627 start_codon:yes stop_codon:yes gene_type:complete
MLVIINSGMGNVQSVSNALSKLGVKYIISNNISKIEQASSLIFPGVGSFPRAMANLKKLSIDKVLKEKLDEPATPFLGICLGMQLLFEESDEQILTKGLGLFEGKVTRIRSYADYPVPHVGWNGFKITQENPLFKNIDSNSRFYYDHSYFVTKTDKDSIALLEYGKEMSVGVWKDNIFGVQFHPEKSQRNGLKLLRNFVNYADKVSLC